MKTMDQLCPEWGAICIVGANDVKLIDDAN